MDGPLRHVTFRVDHDCPMASLSRDVPEAEFHCWSGHRIEVVEVRCPPGRWAAVVKAARTRLSPHRVLRVPDGGVLVWEPRRLRKNPEATISHTLEAHEVLWMQPMKVKAGWEEYDAIAFGPRGEQGALAALSKSWPTQVVRRRDVGPEDVLASLFLSLRPALEAPTDKQARALLAAAASGYYRSPRSVTTADVARSLGIGRSAFEERLRGGENRVMAALAPAMEHHRTQPARSKARPQGPRRGGQSRRRGPTAER